MDNRSHHPQRTSWQRQPYMMTIPIKKIFYAASAAALSIPLLSLADQGNAGGNQGSAGCPPNTLCNPLASTGANSIAGLLDVILKDIVIPVGGVLCALVIIYSGFLFVTARGEPGKIEDAKKTFFYAVIGTLVLLGAATIASIIQTTINQLK